MTTISPDQLARRVESDAAPIQRLIERIGEVIVGQDQMVRGLMIGLLSDGHVLLEGVPGLAKTLTVSTLARGIDAHFARVQFTPDLLPADLVGTLIYNPRDGEFRARKGPIFANLVLADEINRAPAKVQSALLEAMQERHVTIGDETYDLPDPFLVLTTQNPIEQEGTYPLPEAQVDRFMLKLTIGYPTRAQERRIVDLMSGTERGAAMEPVMHADDVVRARRTTDAIHIDDKVKDYIVSLVHATRSPEEHGLKELRRLIEFGASPRASINLARAARAGAFLAGRPYVTPHDVKGIAPEVLRHRVIISYEAQAEEKTSDDVARAILDRVPSP